MAWEDVRGVHRTDMPPTGDDDTSQSPPTEKRTNPLQKTVDWGEDRLNLEWERLQPFRQHPLWPQFFKQWRYEYEVDGRASKNPLTENQKLFWALEQFESDLDRGALTAGHDTERAIRDLDRKITNLTDRLNKTVEAHNKLFRKMKGYPEHMQLARDIGDAVSEVTDVLQEQINELRETAAPDLSKLWQGTWRPDGEYEGGKFITYGGSMWHCNKTGTKEKPGTSHDWSLVVKRGKDGKDLR